MAQQAIAGQTRAGRTGWAGASADGVAVPEVAVRLVAALLALAVAAVHVADQGGVTALNSPDWIGWSYRVIEVGGVLTALALLVPRRAGLGPAWLGPAWLGWAAGGLLGTGPFLAYVASRTEPDHTAAGHAGDGEHDLHPPLSGTAALRFTGAERASSGHDDQPGCSSPEPRPAP